MGVLGYEPLESQLEEGCASGGSESRRNGATGIVASVAEGGLAERAGFRPGDQILSINGEPIRDPIDLLFHGSEARLEIRFLRADAARQGQQGQIPLGPQSPQRPHRPLSPPNPLLSPTPQTITLHRSPWEELGLVLEDFKIRMCNNQCVFCFIHQNPPGLRKGIYFKDGDFRMSFLHGNYITTTNLKEEDFERIISQRLTPMYVSVHTTNHELRLQLLGVRRSSNVLESLQRFARGGIDFHTQIVLCPGLNDGAELDRTIRDLARLRPHLLSIAIVPLGMTEHRENLPKLEPVTPSFCKRVIEQVEPIQCKLQEKHGEAVLFLADEFYVTADRPTPNYGDCEIVHQLENGVGMVWEFMRPWRSVARALPERLDRPRSAAILTGLLGARVLRKVADRLSKIENLRVEIIPCINSLFGRSITVSGLLSGADFRRAILENPGFDRYLIPGNSVRAEGEVFLDDMKLEELNRMSGGRVVALEGTCRDLAEAALTGNAGVPPA